MEVAIITILKTIIIITIVATFIHPSKFVIIEFKVIIVFIIRKTFNSIIKIIHEQNFLEAIKFPL